MITVTYRQEKLGITIKGHAKYDEKGKDIVCAGVSTLFYTLCNSLLKAPRTWFKKEPEMADSLTSDTGVSHIKCTPAEGYEAYVILMYETVLTGLDLLATTYPDNVTLKVMRK